MKKKTFIIFVVYVWMKTLYGLTFHPFVTIRELIRRPVLTPVIVSPFLGLSVLFLVGRCAALLINLYGFNREIVSIFLGGVFFAILSWQLLLFYLFASFFFAIKRFLFMKKAVRKMETS